MLNPYTSFNKFKSIKFMDLNLLKLLLVQGLNMPLFIRFFL